MLTLIWTVILLLTIVGCGYVVATAEHESSKFLMALLSIVCGVVLIGMHSDGVVRPYIGWLAQVLPEKGSAVHILTKWILAILSGFAAYFAIVYSGVFLGERVQSRERSMRVG